MAAPDALDTNAVRPSIQLDRSAHEATTHQLEGKDLTAEHITKIAKAITTSLMSHTIPNIINTVPTVINHTGAKDNADSKGAAVRIVQEVVGESVPDLTKEGSSFVQDMAEPIIDHLIKADKKELPHNAVRDERVEQKTTWAETKAHELKKHFESGLSAQGLIEAIVDAMTMAEKLVDYDQEASEEIVEEAVDIAVRIALEKVPNQSLGSSEHVIKEIVNPTIHTLFPLLMTVTKDSLEVAQNKDVEAAMAAVLKEIEPEIKKVVEREEREFKKNNCCVLL